MASDQQVLFVQGGGTGTHDGWDDRLVRSLREALGETHEVLYPRMPDEGSPSYPAWSAAIRREIADLRDGAILVGHSVGGAVAVHALAERPPPRDVAALVLLAAPFVGDGGWTDDTFEGARDLGGLLPNMLEVHVFHGLRDETVPPAHADLYARAIPQAYVHRLPGRGHQLDDDLADVAEVIRATSPDAGVQPT